MSTLIYILRKSMKNTLKEILRSPGKLILWIFALFIIIGLILVSFFSGSVTVDDHLPVFLLTGIVFGLELLLLTLMLLNALSSGSAIFEMNDVNLLFVSPVNPRKILAYGVARTVKTAFAAGFFILFQSSSLSRFGVNMGGIFVIYFSFMLSVVTLMIASLVIYSVTNGNAKRKRLVKCIGAVVLAVLVVFFMIQYLNTKQLLDSVQAFVQSPLVRFFPVAGWTASGVTAIVEGNVLVGLGLLGLNLLLIGGLVAYILISDPDYFEDVLVSAETAFERKRAIAEGKLDTAAQSSKKVKVTKTGIVGNGASALFGKHMRENFRENRFGILTKSSVLLIGFSIIFALFSKNLFTVLNVLLWSQIMLIGIGRGLKETYTHYIYLIPASSFRKIIWSNMEIVARTLVESVLVFGIVGTMLHEEPVYVLAYFLTFVFFSFLLLGINFMLMRFTGANVSSGLLVVIYYVAVILVMTPGIIAAIVTGILIGGDAAFLIGVYIVAGWELAAGFICFALSSGVLHNCDMPAMKVNK